MKLVLTGADDRSLFACTQRSLVMAPVDADDPVPAIGAYWAQPYSPTTWEIEVLEALASAAASAIDNVEMHRSPPPTVNERLNTTRNGVTDTATDLRGIVRLGGSTLSSPPGADIILRNLDLRLPLI